MKAAVQHHESSLLESVGLGLNVGDALDALQLGQELFLRRGSQSNHASSARICQLLQYAGGFIRRLRLSFWWRCSASGANLAFSHSPKAAADSFVTTYRRHDENSSTSLRPEALKSRQPRGSSQREWREGQSTVRTVRR